MVKKVRLENAGGWISESYPWEYRNVILEFLQSASKSVKRKDSKEGTYWTEFEIDEKKWWRAFGALVEKYAYVDKKAVAILGHVAVTFDGEQRVDYYSCVID